MGRPKKATNLPEKLEKATSALIQELLGQKWYYLVMEGELEAPDHACGNDCICWEMEEER